MKREIRILPLKTMHDHYSFIKGEDSLKPFSQDHGNWSDNFPQDRINYWNEGASENIIEVSNWDEVEKPYSQLPLRRPLAEPSLSFGSILRHLRRKAKLSQLQLANAVNMDSSYISKLENGRVHPPSDQFIVQLAEVLDIDPKQLLQSAGRIPKDISQLLAVNPLALRFIQEALDAQISMKIWEELIEALRDKVRIESLPTIYE